MVEKIDDLIENEADDPDVLRKLQKKIRNMRASAIQQGGEFALENLVFKSYAIVDTLINFQTTLNI